MENESFDMINGSKIFVALCSEAYIKDPVCMMQLGMAVMLDKPIYLPIPEGMTIPENLRRLATKLDYYDGTSAGLNDAVTRMLSSEAQ